MREPGLAEAAARGTTHISVVDADGREVLVPFVSALVPTVEECSAAAELLTGSRAAPR